MLRLRPADYRRLVQLLEEGVTDLDFNKIRNGNYCALVPQENGFYQLWCGDMMLFLAAMDFFELVDLVRAAAQKLDRLK